MFYLSLPLIFLKFWFFEAPRIILIFFASLNNSFLKLISLPILVKTYFKPWKNEYRKGLVGFSIALGMFRTNLVRSLRFLIFVFLIWFTYQNISNSFFPSASSRMSISLLSLFLISEIFFRFKIAKITPKVLVAENDGSDIFKSFTFKNLSIFQKSDKISSVVENLLKEEACLFILEKADIKKDEVPQLFLPKEKVGLYAFEIAKSVKGKFVTTMDILASY